MTGSIGTAALVAALTLAVSSVISPIAAASAAEQNTPMSGDVGARRHDGHNFHHYVYHPYCPYRYGHPYYYSPGPILLFPAPPGWDWW